jgi:hypothetical protein
MKLNMAFAIFRTPACRRQGKEVMIKKTIERNIIDTNAEIC